MELEVGQKVRVLPYGYDGWRTSRNRRGLTLKVAEGEVIKVARVRATVKVQGWDAQFDKNTGFECVKDFGRRIETDEVWAEREHREQMVNRLRELRVDLIGPGSFLTTTLERMLAVLEEGNSDGNTP